MKTLTSIIAAGVIGLSASLAGASEEGGMFIRHEVSQSPENAAASIEAYVKKHDDWLYLATFPLKGGAVTAVKVCYLPLGKDIFAAGMHVAAMMPCGHLAFYEEDGKTQLSMLDLKFMTTLNPDPNLERAVEKGRPAFAAMLKEVLD